MKIDRHAKDRRKCQMCIRDQVTISAINRNYQGRSGPGRLYLASPLTVMVSAFTGRITAWRPGVFS